MSPKYARPSVEAQKTDNRDVEAIPSATTRPATRPAEFKSEEQRDVQLVHRMRHRLDGDCLSLNR